MSKKEITGSLSDAMRTLADYLLNGSKIEKKIGNQAFWEMVYAVCNVSKEGIKKGLLPLHIGECPNCDDGKVSLSAAVDSASLKCQACGHTMLLWTRSDTPRDYTPPTLH